MEGLEWRICDGLLGTLFALAQAYFARGSAREAEYFAQQAQDLADAINTPTMVSRALARKGEIYLHTNRLDEGGECLMQAMKFVDSRALAGVADLQRLRADYDMRNANPEAAQELYEQSIGMLNELQTLFAAMDGSSTRSAVGPHPYSPCLTQNSDSQRKSDVATRRISKAIEGGDAVLPFLLASVLRQQSEFCSCSVPLRKLRPSHSFVVEGWRVNGRVEGIAGQVHGSPVFSRPPGRRERAARKAHA